jgi:hypothetical protein
MDTITHEPVARMEIPASGGAGCFVAASVFVVLSVALALFNLVNFASTPTFGIVAALLWLVLVTANLRFVIREAGGVRQFAINCLGTFASREFVEVRPEGDRTVIGFGYALFHRRFYYLRLERERIVSVDMSSGQATAMAGKDMDDWHVVLWYRGPEGRRKKHIEGIRDEELHIVGPARANATTDAFFRSFVAFLRAAGVELHPTEKENEFRRIALSADWLLHCE